MKNLVKPSIVVLILVAVVAVNSNAQTIRIKGGLNLSTLLEEHFSPYYWPRSYESSSYGTVKSYLRAGFNIGVSANFPATKVFSFEPAILFSTKGSSFKYDAYYQGIEIVKHIKTNTLYIDIPFNAKMSYHIKDVKIYSTLGPYVAVGLTGISQTETKTTTIDNTDKEDYRFGDGHYTNAKRFDYGITAGLGMEYKKIQFGIAYQFGLANLSVFPHVYDQFNRSLQISLGYTIRKA